MAVGSNALHLPTDIQQIVFDVLEHVYLRDDQLANAVRLLGEALQFKHLEVVEEGRDGLVIAHGEVVEYFERLEVLLIVLVVLSLIFLQPKSTHPYLEIAFSLCPDVAPGVYFSILLAIILSSQSCFVR